MAGMHHGGHGGNKTPAAEPAGQGGAEASHGPLRNDGGPMASKICPAWIIPRCSTRAGPQA